MHIVPLKVTPYAGVWIEITEHSPFEIALMSLPTRECGLKFFLSCQKFCPIQVTPYAGVWIEIFEALDRFYSGIVTPYAGVWIEIRVSPSSVIKLWSLPTRE